MLLDGAELSHPFTFTLFTQQQGDMQTGQRPREQEGGGREGGDMIEDREGVS